MAQPEFPPSPKSLRGLPPGWFETEYRNAAKSETTRTICVWWDGQVLYWSKGQGLMEENSHEWEYEFLSFKRLVSAGQSVLQPWVMQLSLREQGTLLTAVRGCDLTPKLPLDSLERQIVSAIRGNFMVPADVRELDSEPGCFMTTSVPKIKWSRLGHYPQHWVIHILHAIEVLGYRHPIPTVRSGWLTAYLQGCQALHLNHETIDQFTARMLEDRIANNTVVS